MKRYAVLYTFAAASMFALLVAVDLLKGSLFADAWPSALLWAVVSSTIFIGTRYYRDARGEHCAVCDNIAGREAGK